MESPQPSAQLVPFACCVNVLIAQPDQCHETDPNGTGIETQVLGMLKPKSPMATWQASSPGGGIAGSHIKYMVALNVVSLSP